MKRLILAGALTASAVVPCVAQAQVQAPTSRHVGVYFYLRRHVVKQFGRQAPGRNIVRDGRADGRKVSDADVTASVAVMERMLAPPPPAPVITATSASVSGSAGAQTAVSTQSYPQSYGGGGSLPYCTYGPESGGNYSAVNPSSGAGGKYQIIPSTWAAEGGTGLPQNASPAEQDRIAAKLYAGGAGASNWVNC